MLTAYARRRTATLGSLACSLLASGLHGQVPVAPQSHRVVDLTHTLDADFPHIPVPGVTFPFALEPIATMAEHGVAANAWKVHEHLGTQIDAPNHFVADGAGLHTLAAGDLLVPAVVIDFRARGRSNPDAELGVQDILGWEARFGRIPDGACVILYTGWDAKLPDATAYLGLDAQGTKHFPGIGLEAARYLVTERSVWGVGTDAISFDPGVDDAYRTHRALLGAGKWALEALANLRHLPPRDATLFVGAPKVRDATGGPARVIAIAPAVPSLDASGLAGVWESEAPERIDRDDGSTAYLTRRFTFRDDTWQIRFSVASDPDGRDILFSGDFGGNFTIGEYDALVDAFETRFQFTERVLTPGNEEVAAALNEIGCGAGAWQAGDGQDLHLAGCEAFRVYPAADCEGEFDLLRRRGDRLYLGERPSDGNLCTEDRRPIALTPYPLVRRP